MLKIFLKHTVYSVLAIFSLIVLAIVSLFIRSRKKHKIIFGTTPILNNKYWSNALKDIGIESETLMSTYYDSINKKEITNSYPLGEGSPEDVAKLTTFLLSNSSKWITGQNIVIDGGRTLL